MKEVGLVLVPAAGLHEGVLEAPELQVPAEGEHAHLLVNMQLARAVEVQDGVERSVK